MKLSKGHRTRLCLKPLEPASTLAWMVCNLPDKHPGGHACISSNGHTLIGPLTNYELYLVDKYSGRNWREE